MKMGTASFEESATIYHIDLHDGIRSFERGGPAVTLAKKIGQVSHKLTFGLLNRHHIAGWGPQTDEHLAFAFVCTDAKKNQKLKATSVLQLRDGRGHTIAMDVELCADFGGVPVCANEFQLATIAGGPGVKCLFAARRTGGRCAGCALV